MILDIEITEKSFGAKVLYSDLNLTIQEGEKVGLIGRNGSGKTTLFNIILGLDTDFQGKVLLKKGKIISSSRQEHFGLDDLTTLDYILKDLPEFSKLHKIISDYPLQSNPNDNYHSRYSEAVNRFSQLGYYQVENELAKIFDNYQLNPDILEKPLKVLSGGQKRLVDLIKIQRSHSDLALIDEPTNHMDFMAKAAFINWLNNSEEAVLVITHDRDVLDRVDRIVEIKDGQTVNFKGNYGKYLKVNKSKVTNQVNEYDLTQKTIENIKSDITRFRRLKEKSRTPSTIRRFKSLEEKAEKRLIELTILEKPSFWIDRESVNDLSPKLQEAYGKYKAKNIRLNTTSKDTNSNRLLVQSTNLVLGYDKPLFSPITFDLREGDRLRLHGLNGAGKTTIAKAIIDKIHQKPEESKIFSGNLAVEKDIVIGVYEQEIDEKYLDETIYNVIEKTILQNNVQVNDQTIKQLLSQYLFDPNKDIDTPVRLLSGGQKARLQLIKMLSANPSLLILDEVTNHLDLPSIEELENAIETYKGAVIYISHDSYFSNRIGGQILSVAL